MGTRIYTDYADYLEAYVTATPDSDRKFGRPVYDPDYGQPRRLEKGDAVWIAYTGAIAFIPFLLILL